MAKKNTPQYIINSYQRKRTILPFIIWGVAGIIFALGVVILVIWFSGDDGFSLGSLFASDTPTPTATATATATVPTNTPTLTPTETITPSPTLSPTPEGPQVYIVEEGDNCWYVAVEKFGVGIDLFLAINNMTMNNCVLSPGQEVYIPVPGTRLPTETPISLDEYTAGQQINYEVQLNDSLQDIASKYYTTIDSIAKLNNITDTTLPLRAGTSLVIQVKLVTPTPTPVPTYTAMP